MTVENKYNAPWKIYQHFATPFVGFVDIIEENGCRDDSIAENVNIKNANLICAAPTMLEALETVLPFMIPGMNWTDETGQFILDKVKSAIKLAKGEQ